MRSGFWNMGPLAPLWGGERKERGLSQNGPEARILLTKEFPRRDEGRIFVCSPLASGAYEKSLG